ncbi:hypothetical protein NUU61_007993 [Penicillium alfredii]|uniref:Uncharacterized protein n=1 Tax=Penicillium alfredii TaxID=1506179 RepID=A0A9W9JZ35_9EURO|nr:uncharacterized protein NUU61_007993 [Penicillium alfredii]KAJ5086686.1 hypothetical protein NUU61_007993 [Penicillium alfredii]
MTPPKLSVAVKHSEARMDVGYCRRDVLGIAHDLVSQAPGNRIEPSRLKAAGIRTAPLTLEPGSGHLPQFFAPYNQELPAPEKPSLSMFDEVIIDDGLHTPIENARGILKVFDDYDHQFYYYSLDAFKDGDSRLFWQFERARLLNAKLREHDVAPVLLYYFMAPRHARVFEGHFDGTSVIIRYTKFFVFTSLDEKALRLFMAYWLGGACADTKIKQCH